MRRVTILGLMIGVGLVAVGIAALRTADELWQATAVSLTLAMLAIAGLGAFQRRGRERAWWAGFAAFGWGYVLLTQGPWFVEQIEPRLLTTYFLRSVSFRATDHLAVIARLELQVAQLRDRESALSNTVLRAPNDTTLVTLRGRLATLEDDLRTNTEAQTAGAPWRSFFPGAKSTTRFVRIGHHICAVLLGLVGATVSARFHAGANREDRPEPDPPPV